MGGVIGFLVYALGTLFYFFLAGSFISEGVSRYAEVGVYVFWWTITIIVYIAIMLAIHGVPFWA